MKAGMVGAALLLSAGPAMAQRVQPWPDIFVSAPIGAGWTASGEIVGRLGDDVRASQLETRLQLGHAIGRNVTLGGGWVHYENFNPLGSHTVENQAVEQVGWTIAKGHGATLATRTRLEERWLTGVSDVSWRWRQQLRFAAALGTASKAPRAVVWAEPFWALNRTAGQTRTLDQLRVFGGINLPISRHADIEFGYLNQRIYRAKGDISNDTVPLILSYRF